MEVKKIDELSVQTIRALCIDMINKAKSGHPGMALGSAPALYVLFKNHLISNPHKPEWINRDRFILSAGHASALLYSLLHLAGYELSLDDLKQFRQIDSLTPGHPEYRHTKGVDATSGPLAQGIAQAVGVALAERAIKAEYHEGEKLVNHYTYCLVGDGCLEEGLSQEAISFAGHHRLNKLIVMYDANKVTLDGPLSLSNSENAKKRFEAENWNVLEVSDGNDLNAIDNALITAKKYLDKPTLIIIKTIIGYGSKNQGTSKVHGSPLGCEDGDAAKKFYGFDYPEFSIPSEVYQNFKNTFINRGESASRLYDQNFEEYKHKYPRDAKVFIDAIEGNVDDYIFKKEPQFDPNDSDASRKASGKCLNELHHELPFLIGGSADVAGSVMTKIEGGVDNSKETPEGRNICFGIREFAMASIQNGMLLHGGLKTYAGAFLVFSDYLKPAIRLAALSRLPAIYLFSHDTIALGEDGPTHQPIEQLAMLRSIPNVNVIRPADTRETYGAWKVALESKFSPTCLILSRQGLPLIKTSSFDDVKKGGYIIAKEDKKLDAIIIASGSEVSLALKAKEDLKNHNLDVRVVSMPSIELFRSQSESYKKDVLSLSKDKIFAVEMLAKMPWYEFADTVMGMDTFGASAPAKDVIKKFDFTSDRLVKIILETL